MEGSYEYKVLSTLLSVFLAAILIDRLWLKMSKDYLLLLGRIEHDKVEGRYFKKTALTGLFLILSGGIMIFLGGMSDGGANINEKILNFIGNAATGVGASVLAVAINNFQKASVPREEEQK